MKLVIAAVLAALAWTSTANADVLNPPSGPVVDESADVDVIPANNPDQGPPMRQRGQRGQRGQMQGQRQRDPARVAKRQQLRQALLGEFDVNGDGRLGPRERVRAVRMLRKLEGKLAQPMQQRGQQRGQQRDRQYRRFMNRYDVNGDGQVGPNEVPRGAANKLRPLDKNGDGWVDRGEFDRR